METIEKLWGWEEVLCNDLYCFKNLHLNYGFISSYHYHIVKDESFIMSGGSFSMYLNIEGYKFRLRQGDFVHIPPGYRHQFAAIYTSGAVFHEISTRDDPKDSIRETQSRAAGILEIQEWKSYPAFSRLVGTDFDDKGNPAFDKGE